MLPLSKTKCSVFNHLFFVSLSDLLLQSNFGQPLSESQIWLCNRTDAMLKCINNYGCGVMKQKSRFRKGGLAYNFLRPLWWAHGTESLRFQQQARAKAWAIVLADISNVRRAHHVTLSAFLSRQNPDSLADRDRHHGNVHMRELRNLHRTSSVYS